jgi:hypothetical protein
MKPSQSPSSCEDTKPYKFEILTGGEKGCLWLDDNQDRIDRYCFGENELDQNGHLIRENCKVACGVCVVGFDPSKPSNEPSNSPSNEPTITTEEPSASPSKEKTFEPSQSPSICQNEIGYKFTNLNGAFKGCGWLGQNPSRVDRYCFGENELDQNGELIRNSCRVTCGLCSSPGIF